MPRFTTKRHEQILAQMVAKVVTRTELSDIADSSVLKHILAAASRQDDEQYYQMSLLLQLFSIDSATGEDLDERAKDIQPGTVSRNAAAKAAGNVVFSRVGTTGTTDIAIGTKVKTSGGVVFTTTSAGQITPTSPPLVGGHVTGQDSGYVSAIADEGGVEGNVTTNTVIKFVQKPSGVDEVTNLAAFAFGLDEETDTAFRARLKAFISSLARCTVEGLENGVLGVQDEDTGATILFSRAVEDQVARGYVTLYIDDGTGSAESSAVTEGTDLLLGGYTWNGSTTVTTSDTSEVLVGDFIGLKSDKQLFEISVVTPNVSVIILNPGALSIPTGATTSYINPENLTEGLSGPPPDTAVGGEENLYTDNIPIKDSISYDIISSSRGVLTLGTHFTLNSAAGQLVFSPALVVSEAVFARYTYYTGLIQLAQKIVDGDSTDRINYPGLRAAGVLVYVRVPTVATQTVEVTTTILDGYTQDDVRADVVEAIKNYINTLGISGDVIISEMISRIMAVAGVYNVVIVTPTTDIILLDDELPRITTPTVN